MIKTTLTVLVINTTWVLMIIQFGNLRHVISHIIFYMIIFALELNGWYLAPSICTAARKIFQLTLYKGRIDKGLTPSQHPVNGLELWADVILTTSQHTDGLLLAQTGCRYLFSCLKHLSVFKTMKMTMRLHIIWILSCIFWRSNKELKIHSTDKEVSRRQNGDGLF